MALSLGFLLHADAHQAEEALEALALKTEAITAGLEGNFVNAQAGITRSALSMLPTFGLVAGAALTVGTAIYEMANKASEAGDKIYLASKATGLSTTHIQGLALAAKEAGIELPMVERAMSHLAVAVSTLSIPSSEASKAIALLGINTRGTGGHLKTLDELLPEIMDKLAGMKDGVQKTAIAAELFGARVGAKLLPIMDKGGKAFEELSKQAEKNSGITAEVAERDHVFQEQLIELKDKLHGVAQQIEQATIPALTYLADFFLKAWYEAANLTHGLAILGLEMNKLNIINLFMRGRMDELNKSIEAQKVALHETAVAYREVGTAASGAADKFNGALKDALDDVAEKHKKGTKALKDHTKAIKDEIEMLPGYRAQLEQMRLVVEASNRAEEKAVELLHKKLEAYKQSKNMGAEPGPLTGLDKLGGNSAALTTALPKVELGAKNAESAIDGLGEAISNMSSHFGKASPMMEKFGQDMQTIAQRQKEGATFGQAFLNVQGKQGKAAAAAGTASVAAYAEEAAGFIKNKRAQAIVMAVMETAKGLGALAVSDYKGAALDFASAAMYGVVAGQSGGGNGDKSAGNIGGGANPGAGGNDSVVGRGGSGGGGSYHQSVVNIYGGQITDTHNLQSMVTMLNQGGGSGTIRLNVAGTSATIPTPAY